MALASGMLFRGAFPPVVGAPLRRAWSAVRYLRALHDGRVGNYVAWLVVGVAVIGALCVLSR